jgi:hypothetical protein
MLLVALSLALATAIGLAVRLRDGRFRAVTPTLDAPLAAYATGTRATFVQISSETCAVCPRSLATLRAVAARTAGVEVVEVHAEARMDLVRELDVRRSPTVLLLDASGTIQSRTSGAMTTERASAALLDLDERTVRAAA